MSYYRVVGRFGNDHYHICVRNSKLVPIPRGGEYQTKYPGSFNMIPADQVGAYNGVFAYYEVSVCILCAANTSLKLVDLEIEEVTDGCA